MTRYSDRILLDSPEVYYRFEEASGTSIADSSGNANTGTLTGTVTYGVKGIERGSSGFTFPGGSTTYVEVARPVQDDFTIEFWIKTNDLNPAGINWTSSVPIVDASIAGFNDEFRVGFGSNKIIFGVGDNTVALHTLTSVDSVVGNGWHHVVCTRTMATGVLNIYINGKLDITGSSAITGTLNDATNLRIGAGNIGSLGISGTLDEVAIYSTVLSADTVAAHYEIGRRKPQWISLASSLSVTASGVPLSGSIVAITMGASATIMSSTMALGTFDDDSGRAAGLKLNMSGYLQVNTAAADPASEFIMIRRISPIMPNPLPLNTRAEPT